MGGLVCRAYLRRFGGDRVDSLVTMGSPHHGTFHAYLANGGTGNRCGPGTGGFARDQRCGSAGAFTSIYSVHDTVISPQDSSGDAGANGVRLSAIGPRQHARWRAGACATGAALTRLSPVWQRHEQPFPPAVSWRHRHRDRFKYLLHAGDHRVLVDCGLFQGWKQLRLKNWAGCRFRPLADAVLLTHAHIDHSGYLPVLGKRGFRRRIYCTDGGAGGILLVDAAHLQEEGSKLRQQTSLSRHQPALPLFSPTTRAVLPASGAG